MTGNLFEPEPDPTPVVAKAAVTAPVPTTPQPPAEPSPNTQLGQLLAAVRSLIGTGLGRVTPHLLADRLGWDVQMVRDRATALQRVYPGLVVVEGDWVKGCGR